MICRISSSQSSVSKSISSVLLAFVTSVIWTPPRGPPVRFQMIHVSMVPNTASPLPAAFRISGYFSSSHLIFGPEKYVARGSPVFALNRSGHHLSQAPHRFPLSSNPAKRLHCDKVCPFWDSRSRPSPFGSSHRLLHLSWMDISLSHGALNHLADTIPDLHGIMFDITRLRIDLGVFHLARNPFPRPVQKYESAACRALVYSSNIFYCSIPTICTHFSLNFPVLAPNSKVKNTIWNQICFVNNVPIYL